VLVGHGPVIETLAALGRSMDYAVDVLAGAPLAGLALTPRASVVVATHGEVDEGALERLLTTDAGYVSLGASRKRSAAVVGSLRQRGVSAERLGRLKAPAGLDIGAVSPQEIAVSILAEVIQIHRSAKTMVAASDPPPAVAVAAERDPVCGMAVDV